MATTPLAAPRLPWRRRSPRASHEALDSRTWQKESRRSRAMCSLPNRGLRFGRLYATRGGCFSYRIEKLLRNQDVPSPATLPPKDVWFPQQIDARADLSLSSRVSATQSSDGLGFGWRPFQDVCRTSLLWR